MYHARGRLGVGRDSILMARQNGPRRVCSPSPPCLLTQRFIRVIPRDNYLHHNHCSRQPG
jgi:hypothetical protein